MQLNSFKILHTLGYLRWIAFLIAMIVVIIKGFTSQFPFDIELDLPHTLGLEWEINQKEEEERLKRLNEGKGTEEDMQWYCEAVKY